MSKETLKPCPFCGGEAVLCEIATGHPRFYMRCEDCHSEAGICATEEEAEMIWNSRPIEDALRKRVEELEVLTAYENPTKSKEIG